MKRVSVLGLVTALVISMPLAASALTFKKGQVLGSDGQIYDGASPDLRDRLIKKAQRTGESAGVTAGKLFVVVMTPSPLCHSLISPGSPRRL